MIEDVVKSVLRIMNNIKKDNKLTDLVAIALQYRSENRSPPKIVASGKGSVAQTILDIAKREGIAIEKNEELASILALLEVGDVIPIETFAVVAEIISYIYKKANRSILERGHSLDPL